MENYNCPVKEYCGSCKYLDTPYLKQLEIKQKRIESLLNKYGKVSPIIGMEDPNHYRNKIRIPFSYDEYGNIIYGNYMEDSHFIVQNDNCILADENAYKIVKSVKRLIEKYHISVFDEQRMSGCIRNLLIRVTNSGEYMLVLVTGTMKIYKQDLFIRDILKYNPEIKTIIQNFNNKRTSYTLGPKNTVLYGNGYIVDKLCCMNFRISASSFYQVNKRQTEVLYRTAIDMAEFKGNEILVDAYCGTGTIGLVASKSVKEVLGVELNQSAIKDAIINKKINNVKNISFLCDDAGHYMNQLANKHTHIDAVIMDPPRSGSDIKFMKSMVAMKPEKIIYISCGPDSLAENLKFLNKYYDVKKIQPVDMFPYTSHCECICRLDLRR